jgi:hypothetical protein
MKLIVFNGSPRGIHSNTGALLRPFLEGFTSAGDNSYELALLIRRKQSAGFVRLFQEAEHVLLAFPLYFDAMPGLVKDFIESLEPLCGRVDNPSIAFFVHSGYPEATHAGFLEPYLARLAERLGCQYQGTVIQGGSEGIRVPRLRQHPVSKLIIAFAKATNLGRVGHLFSEAGLQKAFNELGRDYGRNGVFDRQLLEKLKRPQKVNLFGYWVVQFGIDVFYWNNMLQANHAFAARSAHPYAQKDLPG